MEDPAVATSNTSADKDWLRSGLDHYRRALETDVIDRLVKYKNLVTDTHRRGRKIIFAGNGASAAISSHAAVDFTKAAGIRAVNFNEADLITCFANDFGYDRWIEKALDFYADSGDLVTLISSSGRSPNVVRAAEHARAKGLTVVGLTGFEPDNPLRQLADLDLWYNVIETTHQTWLLLVCDLIIASAPSPARP